MKLYVSGHDAAQARALAEKLKAKGHVVLSTWHDTDERPELGDSVAWAKNANRNFCQISESYALVLLAGPDKYTGGKFVEAGYAIGQGVPVFILGRTENGMLWSVAVSRFVNEDQLFSELGFRDAEI